MNGDLSLDISDRLIYAAFPKELKAALRDAAKRNHWDRETWRYQTQCLNETLEASTDGPGVITALVVAYQTPVEITG
jgi:hypothetical protein